MKGKEYVMMKVPYEDVGRALANADDHVQAELFNEFGRQLKMVCREDNLEGSIQLWYMAQSLDAHGKELVTQLAADIQLEEERAKKGGE